MGENKIENLFEKAIKRNELVKFALGEDEYYILDKEYDEHWIHGSWINYIIPYRNEKGDNAACIGILNLFKAVLNIDDLNIEKKGDILLYHLHVYYYLKHEGKIICSGLIMSINEELNTFLNVYLKILNEEKSSKIVAVQNAINLIKSRGGLLT